MHRLKSILVITVLLAGCASQPAHDVSVAGSAAEIEAKRAAASAAAASAAKSAAESAAISAAAASAAKSAATGLPDFTGYTDVKAKKKAFFDFMRPIIQVENSKL